MTMTGYPRVLAVSGESIGGKSSTGITLANLFLGWPADRIAQIYCDVEPPVESLCPRHFALSLADVPLDRFVRSSLRGKEDKILGPPSAKVSLGEGGTVNNASRGLLRSIAGSWADMFTFRASGELWRWIDEFRPEIIYSALGNGRWLNFVLKVARRCRLRIVPHFMDDWPVSLFSSHILMYPSRLALTWRLKKVLRLSLTGMTISEAMAEEYERRYGMKFEAFMNCVEVPADCPPMPEHDSRLPLEFVYVGGLHLDRWLALKEIGEAMARLRSEGMNIELVVYAPPDDLGIYGEVLRSVSALRLGGSLPPEEIPQVLSSADVLVHVESFDRSIQQFTRFSLSTKLPQYMAMGRPILGYGPGDIASIRYIKQNGFGIAQDLPGADKLLSAIRQMASSQEQRRILGRRGWEVAQEKHSNVRVREHFKEVISESVPRTE